MLVPPLFLSPGLPVGHRAAMVGLPTVEATELDVDEASELLREYGCVVVRGLVGASTCQVASRHVDQRLTEALRASGHDTTADVSVPDSEERIEAQHRHFGNVLSPSNRRDLKLALADEVRGCLDPMLRVLRPVIAAQLTDDAELCELSALIADPGAQSQPLHPDTQITGAHAHCALLTVFLALDDVRADMGPTEVVLRTHTAEAHAALREGNRVAQSSPSPASAADAGEAALIASGYPAPVPAILSAGDALLMDSRTIHRGSSNVAERARRRLAYASFLVPANPPPGSTYSLLEEYAGRFRLRAHERWRG